MSSLKSSAKEAYKKNKQSSTQKAVADRHILSAEFVQESDEEERGISDYRSVSDDDDLPANLVLATPKANGKIQRQAVTISSESGSGSGSADESSSEEEDGSSEEEDGSSEEEEVPVNKQSNAPESAIQSTKPSSTKAIIVRVEPPSKFIPPAGFEQASIDETPAASHLFNELGLEGKQIWYITAPASISMTSIEQMSLQSAKEGKKAYSRNGKDYELVQDDAGDKTYTKIMVPAQSNDGYQTRSKPIDRVLHLQQIVDLPSVYNADNGSVNSSISSRATIPAKKPVRPQPKGLKMRFHPIGFGSGKPGKIGSDSGDESSTDKEIQNAPFRRPFTLDEDASKSSDVEMQDAPPLFSKSKSKPEKIHKKISSKENRSSKRKHEGEKKSHKSLYRSNSLDETPLKKLKTKDSKSQKTLADRSVN
ncbi:hypothetical protein B7494_g1811 [Chlorociboria aeruginascens]|nr:hypothetical protein B7494_g1811 [Chlorociboria aeruginascens]